MRGRTFGVALFLTIILLCLATAGEAAAWRQGGPHTAQSAMPALRAGLSGPVTQITLDSTTAGIVRVATGPSSSTNLDVQATTAITVPGVAESAISDLRVGDFVAVMTGDPSPRSSIQAVMAISILVRPVTPVGYRHVAAVVADAPGGQVTLVDTSGNILALPPSGALQNAALGDVVTLVVTRDPATGGVKVLAAVPATQTHQTLAAALRQAEQQGDAARAGYLKTRLREQATQQLAAVSRAAARAGEVGNVLSGVLPRIRAERAAALAAAGLPPPDAFVSGRIVQRDAGNSSILVLPDIGQPVNLTVNDKTAVDLPEGPGGYGDLELAFPIDATYDPGSFVATQVRVIRQELGQDRVWRLEKLVNAGELQGRLIAVAAQATPPTLQVQPSDGRPPLTLTVTPETRIMVADGRVALAILPMNSRVSVLYSADTNVATEVRTVGEETGEAHVAGVVSGVARKAKQVTVTLTDGSILLLHVPDASLVERDGVRTTIAGVQLGDVVRPASRYRTDGAQVVTLLLKSPGKVAVQGVVTGKLVQSGADWFMTIMTPGSALLTLRVPANRLVTRNGQPATAADVRTGDKVTGGLYDAALQESMQLTLTGP